MVKDGLEVLREQLDLAQIMELIEGTAMWVDRATFEYLPIWYPEEARGDQMYKANWTEPLLNTTRRTGVSVHKRVGNTSANKALTKALGLRQKERTNWTCCHIWGVDDSSYQISNSVASDKRYYSCVGNMLLLPTPLKAFTDVMMDVKAMLRIAAASYYSWKPEDSNLISYSELENICQWEAYPQTWPHKNRKSEPKGVAKFDAGIRKSADVRKSAIADLLESAGEYFPRLDVLEALQYWRLDEDIR